MHLNTDQDLNRKEWVEYLYPSPEVVSGDVFQSSFNGFRVSSLCPCSSQRERFPGPNPCAGPGYSQRDYTIKTTLKDSKDYPLLKSSPVLEVFDFFTLDLFAVVLLIFPDACK